MGYFQNINSLAELKKSYRVLALQNHPDKGGSTETMQQINIVISGFTPYEGVDVNPAVLVPAAVQVIAALS